MHTAPQTSHAKLVPVEPLAAFDDIAMDGDAGYDPATALLEYLSSTSPWRMPPAGHRSGRLVSLIVDRDAS